MATAKTPMTGKRPVGRPRKNPRSKEEEEEFRMKQKKLLAQKLAKWDALKHLSSDEEMDDDDFMDDDDDDSDASLIEMLKQSKAELNSSGMKYKPVGRPKLAAPAVRNQGTMCKPPMQTKSISCTPIRINKNAQTEFGNPDEKKIFLPVPFPVLTPTPLIFNTAPIPHPIPLPLPLPIPFKMPMSELMIKKLINQLNEYKETLPEEGDGTVEEKQTNTKILTNILLQIQLEDKLAHNKDELKMEVKEDDNKVEGVVRKDGEEAGKVGDETGKGLSEESAEKGVSDDVEMKEDDDSQETKMVKELLQEVLHNVVTIVEQQPSELQTTEQQTSELQTTEQQTSELQTTEQQLQQTSEQQQIQQPSEQQQVQQPSDQQPTDQQQLTPQQQLQQQLSMQQQQYMKQQQKQQLQQDNPTTDTQTDTQTTTQTTTQMETESEMRKHPELLVDEDRNCSMRIAEVDDSKLKIKYSLALKAFKQYARASSANSTRRTNTELVNIPSEELAYRLCSLVQFLQQPQQQSQQPLFTVDTIYYIAIGIQYYLYLNGRMDNIFDDNAYINFYTNLSQSMMPFTIRLNPQGLILCRVTEEQLWEANILGSHSPATLLFTLVYMNTKNFLLLDDEQHLLLSFSNVMKQWKKNAVSMDGKPARTVYLKYNPISNLHAAADKRQKVDPNLPYEQLENVENPLRCPVKLYEFYLSKCPESIKNRNDLFYLQPEPSCMPESPVWFSVGAVQKDDLTLIIARVKAVREVQESILSLRSNYLNNIQLSIQQQVIDAEGNKCFVERPLK